jgi:hypothetical protein
MACSSLLGVGTTAPPPAPGRDGDGQDREKDGATPSRKGGRPAAPREAGDETAEDLPGEADPAERRPGRD